MIRVAALLLAVPLAAQAPPQKWTLGVHGGNPELTGFYKDIGSSATSFDLVDDLNLELDKTGMGVHMEYSGSRFGFSMAYSVQDYAGQNRLDREFEIAGKKFSADMSVLSDLSHTVFDVNWTIKLLRHHNGWLGVDLGMQGWYLDVQAEGRVEANPTLSNEPPSVKVNETYGVPIPHIGVSGAYQALNNRLQLGGKAHFLAYSGAKYTHFVADARYYFLPWLGVRAYFDAQSFDVPDGAIMDDVELKLDRSGLGFGLVARW